jgi:hypothetical protein
VFGVGQILVAATISTSSGFSTPTISQSTSFALVLLLFVLGPFSIHSGAPPRYWAVATVVVGSLELAVVAKLGVRVLADGKVQREEMRIRASLIL